MDILERFVFLDVDVPTIVIHRSPEIGVSVFKQKNTMSTKLRKAIDHFTIEKLDGPWPSLSIRG